MVVYKNPHILVYENLTTFGVLIHSGERTVRFSDVEPCFFGVYYASLIILHGDSTLVDLIKAADFLCGATDSETSEAAWIFRELVRRPETGFRFSENFLMNLEILIQSGHEVPDWVLELTDSLSI